MRAWLLRCLTVPPEDPVAVVHATVKAELAKRGMSQDDLAERLGMQSSTLSRMLTGKSLKKTHDTFARLRDIEKLFDLDPGVLVRLLDSVGDRGATAEAILSDASLSVDAKQSILAILERFTSKGATVTPMESRRAGRGAARAAAETGEPPSIPRAEQKRIDTHVAKRKPAKKNAKKGRPEA